MKVTLPAEVTDALAAFLEAGRSGSFILDVKDGRVLGWRVPETGRVQRSEPKYAMR